MNGNIYRVRPLYKVSFFQKVLKQLPEENAVIELNNLLASTPISGITPEKVENIERRYRLGFKTEFLLNLEEFYAVYLNYCLQDKVLNEQELKELSHLKMLLDLDEHSIQKLHCKIGEIVYKKSFEEVVADGRITEEEIHFLNKLQHSLRLPKELADKISSETRAAFVQNYVTKAIADQRLSPAEEQELNNIATSLNVVIQLSEHTKGKLNKLKQYWALENLSLSVVHTDMPLQKEELCFFAGSPVAWYEGRGGRVFSSVLKPHGGFKAIKEFYLHKSVVHAAGNIDDSRKLVDSGALCLTNKRIVLNGGLKNSVIRLDKVLGLNPLHNGVEIIKATGKNAVLQLGDQSDVFCMLLERLLNEANGTRR